jgi:hypothetical protein
MSLGVVFWIACLGGGPEHNKPPDMGGLKRAARYGACRRFFYLTSARA